MPPDGTAPDLVTRSQGLLVRAVRADQREADFIASTETIDRYDEVIDQATWRLDRFKSNPVILYGHQSYELPIGQAVRVEVKDGQLECTIRFATEEANPQAEKVWRLVQEKVLRAVSVGFRPQNGRYELRDGKDVYVLSDCELREISVVAIPANPDCLAKMKAASYLAADADTQLRLRESMSASTFRFDKDGVYIETIPDRAVPTTPSPSPNSPPKGVPETTMDLKELQSKLDSSEKALIDAKASEKALSDKLTATEARVKTLETERDTLSTEKSALAKEHEKASTDRDAALDRAKKAEDALIDFEVEQFVGKKIEPKEKAEFVELRKASPTIFKSTMEKRPDMKLTEQVVTETTTEKAAPQLGAPADKGGDFWTK